MSSAEPQLGEYAKKCIEVLRTFAPGREDEVEPAIRLLNTIYAKEGDGAAEKHFKEEYRIYQAAAETIATSELVDKKYDELVKEGTAS